jgi:transposase
MATSSLHFNRWSAAMPQPNDLSRSLVALDQNSTIIAVVELSQSSWLVGGPGIERQPCKKLEPSPERLLAVLHRWSDEAVKADRTITRIALACEAGRDGFWLARWLAARGVEAHVIHPSSVAVSREHRRAKTDRLDTELLKRGFLGWLRGERGHCSMVRVPTLAEEDAKRPNRERECLVKERTRLVNRMKGTLARLGIRNFRPTLRKAAEHLAALYTPEGSPLPPNVSAGTPSTTICPTYQPSYGPLPVPRTPSRSGGSSSRQTKKHPEGSGKVINALAMAASYDPDPTQVSWDPAAGHVRHLRDH